MIGTLPSPKDDRAWRLGAYAFATLVHLPLILAVQEFGSAIAAARPVESVITLLDAPETERVSAVETEDGRADAVQQSASISTAVPLTATRLGETATSTSIAPAETSQTAAVLGTNAQPVASVVASDASASALATPIPGAPTVPSPSIAAVETASPSPAPAIAPTPAPPVDVTAANAATNVDASDAPSSAAAPFEIATALSVRSAGQAPSAVPSSAVSPSVPGPAPTAATTADPVAAMPVAATGAQAVQAAPMTAEAPPRIAILAAGAVPAASGTSVAAVSGTAPGVSTGTAVVVATPSASVVSSVAGTVPTARAAAPVGASTVTSPVVDPSQQTLGGSTSAPPTGIVDPASRLAALPPARAGADRAALNEFVRGYQGGGCFAALTVETGGDDVAVSGFSRDETALAGFEDALGKRAGPRPAAAARKVSEAQCSVLAFARAQAAYPDFPVRLALDPDRIASGGTIGGRVTGAGDRPVTMLILDDEGRIQDATFLLTRQPEGDWTFRTPLSLTGSPVPTVQLFVALAGSGPLAAMRPPVPVEARRYFVEIDRLLKAKGEALDVALAGFTVDQPATASAP